MDKLIHRRMSFLYTGSIAYIIITFISGMLLSNGLVVFLAWNMVLATLVLVLSEIVVYLIKKKVRLWLIILFGVLWMLFFPNALYLITDLIHIQNYPFFLDYPDLYNLALDNWFVFLFLVIGALYGAKLGIVSLKQLLDALDRYLHNFHGLILSFVFILSSFGIFIGRFLRLNSWNFFDLITQIGMVFSHGGFLFGFVGLFFLIHWVVYFVFSFDEKKRYNSIEKIHTEEKS